MKKIPEWVYAVIPACVFAIIGIVMLGVSLKQGYGAVIALLHLGTWLALAVACAVIAIMFHLLGDGVKVDTTVEANLDEATKQLLADMNEAAEETYKICQNMYIGMFGSLDAEPGIGLTGNKVEQLVIDGLDNVKEDKHE